jgi:hypothetical protein
MYSLDTSMFMDWQARYYPLDVFRSLELKIEQLIDAGDCAAVALVKEEIDSVGTPDLQTWAKGHAGLFVPLATDIQLAAASIEARYPDLRSIMLKTVGLADPMSALPFTLCHQPFAPPSCMVPWPRRPTNRLAIST